MRNVPHRFTHLNTWSPLGGAVGGGLSRSCNLTGGNVFLGTSFEIVQLHYVPGLLTPVTMVLCESIKASSSDLCLYVVLESGGISGCNFQARCVLV